MFTCVFLAMMIEILHMTPQPFILNPHAGVVTVSAKHICFHNSMKQLQDSNITGYNELCNG